MLALKHFDASDGRGKIRRRGTLARRLVVRRTRRARGRLRLCDSKIAADFQRRGDWCTKHDRPDTQCFACHPELEARFAAQYEAKYGKQPPKPEAIVANQEAPDAAVTK